jgi:cytochrome c
VKRIGIWAAVALTASLLLARVHPFGDAGLYRGPDVTAPLLAGSSATPQARALLVEKCADCHSQQTRAPFYGRFAPVSWLLERDIVEARKAMDLSGWESYSVDQRETLQAKMVEETRARRMPPLQYRMIHSDARIQDADVQALVRWTKAVQSGSAQSGKVAAAEGSAGEGDPVRGREIFEKRCTGCHALETDREGPRLRGVFGREAGSVAGYAYSDALKTAHLVWSDGTLDQWLADPDTLVPGNNMEFHVAKAEERRDVIRFLRQSSGQ